MRLVYKFLILFLGFLIINTFFVTLVSASPEGCFCNSLSSCYPDGCTRKTITNDGSINYDLCRDSGCNGAYAACYNTSNAEVARTFCIQQPPCCADMVKRNDRQACCFPEIGFCHPYFCNQVGNAGNVGCGHYWEYHDNAPDWMAKGYGCVIGTSAESLKPIFGLPQGVPGANAPIPTDTPYPTSIPTEIPVDLPTNSPVYTPTTIPTAYIPPTQYVFPIISPAIVPTVGFSFHTRPLKRTVKRMIINFEKVTTIPLDVLNLVISTDQSLENFIQRIIFELIGTLKKN